MAGTPVRLALGLRSHIWDLTGEYWFSLALPNQEQVRKGASVARPRSIDGGGVAPFLTCPASQALLVFKLNQHPAPWFA